MTKTTLSSSLAGIAAGVLLLLGATSAEAHHQRHDTVRLKLDVHTHGPAQVPLRRLIKRQHHVDLDGYRLRAVVIHNRHRSKGFARLRTGAYETSGYRLRGRDRIRIDAPHSDGRWQLRLSPGSRVRTVTAVLEPRWQNRGRYRWGHRDDWAYRHHGRHRGGYYAPDQNVWTALIHEWQREQRREAREERREQRREARAERRAEERELERERRAERRERRDERRRHEHDVWHGSDEALARNERRERRRDY